MKIKLNFGKKAFVFLLVLVVLFGGLMVVHAFNNNFNRLPGDAVSFGHSADELIVNDRGTERTFQEMFDAGLNFVGGSTALVMFNTACPTGWTRFTDLDGRVPKGAVSYGGIGGADTHNHTWTADSYTAYNSWRPSLATDLVIGSVSSWPPYRNVVWCVKTESICTSFTYNCGQCTLSNTMSCSVATSTPAGCIGGNPVLTQSCDFGGPGVRILDTLNTNSVPRAETGWYEQRIEIVNPTSNTFWAVQVSIGNVPNGVVVTNALGFVSGTDYPNGPEPYVIYNYPLSSGQTKTLTIEYYVPPNSLKPTATTFSAKAVSKVPEPNPIGSVLSGVSVTRTVDNHYLLRFASLTGHKYYIQYSNNGLDWFSAIPYLAGTGGYLAWVDNGPPKTISDTASVAVRYYRVIIF
ncbi:MAG: hypothetical protein AABW80_02325 [Nanoarchaeota archaeon]